MTYVLKAVGREQARALQLTRKHLRWVGPLMAAVWAYLVVYEHGVTIWNAVLGASIGVLVSIPVAYMIAVTQQRVESLVDED